MHESSQRALGVTGPVKHSVNMNKMTVMTPPTSTNLCLVLFDSMERQNNKINTLPQRDASLIQKYVVSKDANTQVLTFTSEGM